MEESHNNLCQLPAQGVLARSWKEASPSLLAKPAVFTTTTTQVCTKCLSWHSSHKCQPSHRGKKSTDLCTLCKDYQQSLLHIINHCQVATDLCRYSWRHDEVHTIIGDFIRASLPPHLSLTIDHPSQTYSFYHHITPTNMHPDIIWWSENQKLWLFELTISFKSLVADSQHHKQANYQDLVEAGRAAGYKTELITIEVGSWGMLSTLISVSSCLHSITPRKTRLTSTQQSFTRLYWDHLGSRATGTANLTPARNMYYS